jgi:arsenate reductase
MVIYHNPRCRKSRETLELIRSKGVEPEIIEYLKNPLTEKEIKELLQLLGFGAEKLVRKNEAIYKDQYKGLDQSENDVIKMLADNPKLIERPIVVEGKKAVLGRPPENVLELLN